MNKKQVTRIEGECKKIFTRHDRKAARRLFENGETISLMTADRNPMNSPSTEINYTRGESLFYNAHNTACTFDDVLEDFAEWQENDGYGHMPDRRAAREQRFSYWTWYAVPA